MPEELQNLLERIQKDGVDKAQARGDEIEQAAHAKAKGIVEDAERKAGELVARAEKDAKALEDRGTRALEQAARDVILSVRQALDAALAGIVKARVSTALSADQLPGILSKMVQAYFAAQQGGSDITILLSPADQDAVKAYFTNEFVDRLSAGLTVEADDSVVAGFRVSVVDEKVEHDFSEEAVTEALCSLLRPHLADIVKNAVKDART